MAIDYSAEDLRQIWPRAPQGVIDAFVADKPLLDAAGITATRTRLCIAFSQVEHETNGFTIRDLTENINYSAGRAAQIWPRRFRSAADCYRKVGSWQGDPQFKFKLIDNVYGGRMGNRPPPAHDGSRYIGRAGPQVTGKNGYAEVGKRCGLPLVEQPELACAHSHQPAILAAFWGWKQFNPVADGGGLRAVTKGWNGGYIGMADREARAAGNSPIIARMQVVQRIAPVADKLPGKVAPLTKDTIDAATASERRLLKRSGLSTGAAVGAEAGNQATSGKATTEQPAKPFIDPVITYSCIGVLAVVLIVAALALVHKRAAVRRNWR